MPFPDWAGAMIRSHSTAGRVVARPLKPSTPGGLYAPHSIPSRYRALVAVGPCLSPCFPLRREFAVAVDQVGLTPKLPFLFTGELEQHAPGNGRVAFVVEAAVVHQLPHGRVEVRDQPVVVNDADG